MAKTFCIPRSLVKKLKESALRGQIDIRNLYSMSSPERREFFTKYTDKSLGGLINTEFEKAIVSKDKDALTKWAESVFNPEAKNKPIFKNVIDKIKQLDEIGVLNPKTRKAYLEDLVSDKLGVSVSPEEVKIISDKAKVIGELQKKLGDNIGDPAFEKETIDFFVAKKDMDSYLEGLTPSSQLKILTGTIGRGMMLASVKSPLLNIGSNTEMAIFEGLSRRLSSLKLTGLNNDLALDYFKLVNKIYQKSGYDISRMINLTDTGTSGARVLGDVVSTKGPGVIRKVGQVVEDIVFKQLMGAPDVAFSAAHFADSTNINAAKYISSKGLKGEEATKEAKKLMEDAMRIKPQTEAGEILREQAITDAQYATYTNKSVSSQISEGFRNLLNKASGDLRAGDFFMPFVKTPANVIETGLDYAGLGAFKGLAKITNAIRKGELKDQGVIRSAVRDIIKTGIGLIGAVIITNQLEPDDFSGPYDYNRQQIEQLRTSTANAIRIGDKWISLDWFGPLGTPIASIMYAKKYGESGLDKAYQYFRGAKSQFARLPGVDVISEVYDSLKQAKVKSVDEAKGEIFKSVIDQARARIIPSIISDVATATDQYQRETGNPIEVLQSKIPGLRGNLPIKRNVFGEPMETENSLSTILFGSRVKTSTETPIVAEVVRLSEESGKNITFSDWLKSSSKDINQFKEKIGDEKFKEAVSQYGKELKSNLEEGINSEKYRYATYDDKLKIINGADSKAKTEIFKKYNFRYQSK
jgi:hypothetical protein